MLTKLIEIICDHSEMDSLNKAEQNQENALKSIKIDTPCSDALQ